MDLEGNAPPDPRRRGWLGYLLWPVFLLILYVLSFGPVAQYYQASAPPDFVATFYAPLQVACNAVPAFRSFFDWYVQLWVAKRP